MFELIKKIDGRVINQFQRFEITFARIAIFVIYFWFGFLKLLGISPITPVAQALFEKTLGFMPFTTFYIFFSLFEMAIGVLFLIRGFERLAIVLIGLHLVTAILPLIFLPHIAWQAFLVPTLVGQYIIKNILIALAAVVVGSRLVPLSTRK